MDFDKIVGYVVQALVTGGALWLGAYFTRRSAELADERKAATELTTETRRLERELLRARLDEQRKAYETFITATLKWQFDIERRLDARLAAVPPAEAPAAAEAAAAEPAEEPEEVKALRAAKEAGLRLEGKVIGWNRGGFHVALEGGHVTAFCPNSEMELGRPRAPETYVDRTLAFKVIKVQRRGRRVVLSRQAVLKEERGQRLAELRGRPGAVLKGTVTSITDFGAFVDLGGLEGLVHVSELSRRRVAHPKEAVALGQEVEVKLLKIDQEGERISLSIKALEPDPWRGVAGRYPAGAPFTGKIARKTEFGLFVELEPEIDGLVHLSRLPPGVALDDASLAVGETISGWVQEVDGKRKRVSLSLREIAKGDPWKGIEERFAEGAVVQGTVESAAQFGVFINLEPGLTGLLPTQLEEALRELAALGLVSSDTFAAVRHIAAGHKKTLRRHGVRSLHSAASPVGRWSRFPGAIDPPEREAAVERWCRQLLARYGVVFRDLLAREPAAPPWYELVRVLRRLELRGEVRGGRFIAQVAGEQFALEAVVSQLRELRDQPPDGSWALVCAADPVNLCGILTSGDRIAATHKNYLILQAGRCVAAKVTGRIEFFAQLVPEVEAAMRRSLQYGRRISSNKDPSLHRFQPRTTPVKPDDTQLNSRRRFGW